MHVIFEIECWFADLHTLPLMVTDFVMLMQSEDSASDCTCTSTMLHVLSAAHIPICGCIHIHVMLHVESQAKLEISTWPSNCLMTCKQQS